MKLIATALISCAFGYWIGINEIRPEPECVEVEIHKQPVWDDVKHEMVPIKKCLKRGIVIE